MEELLRRGVELWIVPMYPRGAPTHTEAGRLLKRTLSEPLLSWEIVKGTLKAFWRAPRRASEALLLLITPRPRHLLKNLLVYPKGLWLGLLALEYKVDHIHVHWAATTASMAMVASAISGIPWSITAHRWDIVENNLLRRKAERACFFRCISEKTLEMARERGVPLERALVLHMGVRLPGQTSFEISPEKLPSRHDKFVVLCPASFIEVKGHRYLLEALRLLPPQIELWLAGEGELKPTIERQVKDLGLRDQVRFLGFLPRDQLLALYQEGKVDLVVLPSVDLGAGLNEGIPVSLIEAMSCGIPVVSTATGGIPELLRGGAGVLVPPKDPYALAEAIDTLYRGRIAAASLAEAGRARVEVEFNVEDVVERLLELWRRCV
ncbi:glycosyltransferase [Thermus sp.]|uniref:glycosyltransferase n=1 Tax=Thermus sp. TaxID=275 RepID=UPI00307DEA62